MKREKSDQNIVMNEEFVKNIVMNAKFDPKVVIRIPNRDPFFVTQYLETHTASSDQDMKKLMSLRVHVMMQCCMRQLSADRYWLHEPSGGHASWRTSMRKFTKESTTYFCTKTKDLRADGNIQTRHSESNEKLRKTTALESHFEEHAKEGWERIWINFWHAELRC